jgi:hypothetical protein
LLLVLVDNWLLLLLLVADLDEPMVDGVGKIIVVGTGASALLHHIAVAVLAVHCWSNLMSLSFLQNNGNRKIALT